MAVGWAVIGILVVIALLALEFKDLKHRILLVIVVIGLGFMVASLGVVYFGNDIDLGSFDGIVEATRLYFTWLGHFFENVGDISGYAIDRNWGVNETGG